MQLRELSAALLEQQEVMAVARRRDAERALQHDVDRGRAREVAAAHDPGDSRGGVVHHHGQVVGDGPVASAQHRVAPLGERIL